MFITNRKQMTTMMSEQYFRCVVSAYAKRIFNLIPMRENEEIAVGA